MGGKAWTKEQTCAFPAKRNQGIAAAFMTNKTGEKF